MKAMNGLERLQMLETGCRCEEAGCSALAKWYITFDDASHSWCPKHTTKHMRERELWQVKVRAPSRR